MPDIAKKIEDNTGMGISTYAGDTENLDLQREGLHSRMSEYSQLPERPSISLQGGTPEDTKGLGSDLNMQVHVSAGSGRVSPFGGRRQHRKLKVFHFFFHIIN